MADTQDAAQAAVQRQVEFKRLEDFTSLHANHVYIESSAWDLRLIFGELDQGIPGQATPGKEVIEQHTAISIPWPQAKLFSHILRVHIAAAELENGKIPIPSRVIPPEATLPPNMEDNDVARAIRELANKMRAEFIAGL